MVESIAAEGCLSIGCILSIYFWGAFMQVPLAQLVISHQVQTFVKNLHRYLAAWSHILISFLVKDFFESSLSLITLEEDQLKVHSDCTLRVY